MNRMKFVGLIVLICIFALLVIIQSESEEEMPSIPQIKIQGTTYDIKDGNARNQATQKISDPFANAWAYYFGTGYFDSNFVFTNSDAIVTLKIPLQNPSFVILSSPDNMQNGISNGYCFTYELEDGSLVRTHAADGLYSRKADKTDTNYVCVALSFENVKYVYIAVLRSVMDTTKVKRNSPLFEFTHSYGIPLGISRIHADNTSNDICYIDNYAIGILTKNNRQITTLWMVVNAGDQITGIQTIPYLNFKGGYLAFDGSSRVKITDGSFTCPKDGIVCIFYDASLASGTRYIPARRLNLHKTDIDDLDIVSNNPYDGMNAVAFGTSLTYRSQTTGGYLQYLPTLSGMTFDNQGIGSSKIKGNLLTAIKNYENWANKNVCILEGFVNDFYYEGNALGTWKDNTEATVCGCVRNCRTVLRKREKKGSC